MIHTLITLPIMNKIIQPLQCGTIFQFLPLRNNRKSLWKPLLPEMPSLGLPRLYSARRSSAAAASRSSRALQTDGWSSAEPPVLSSRETLLAGSGCARQDGHRDAEGNSWLTALAQPQGLVCRAPERQRRGTQPPARDEDERPGLPGHSNVTRRAAGSLVKGACFIPPGREQRFWSRGSPEGHT